MIEESNGTPFKKPLGNLGKEVEVVLRGLISTDPEWNARAVRTACLASSIVSEPVKAALRKSSIASVCNTMKRVAKDYPEAVIEGKQGGSFKVTYTA